MFDLLCVVSLTILASYAVYFGEGNKADRVDELTVFVAGWCLLFSGFYLMMERFNYDWGLIVIPSF